MKRIFCIILTIALTVASLALPVEAETLLNASNTTTVNFSDVDRATIQGQAIYKLAEAGILLGDGDGKFRPYDPITRGELSKIVNAIFGYTEKAESGFADMDGDEWFYPYVLVAKKAGYIIGYDDGTFRADDLVSREQACVILCRVAGLYDLGVTFTITDPVAEWAMPYVQMVLGNGLMSLEAENTFRATQNITREEFCIVFANFLKTPPTTTPPTPSVSIGTGGSGSGSDRPVKDEKPNYAKLNEEMVKQLRIISADIEENVGKFRSTNSQAILNIVKTCIDDAIGQASKVELDSDFIRKEYDSEIERAKVLFDEMNADDVQRALFQQEIINNLTTSTINSLLNEFGLSDYIITE